jgi:hypothetical protein
MDPWFTAITTCTITLCQSVHYCILLCSLEGVCSSIIMWISLREEPDHAGWASYPCAISSKWESNTQGFFHLSPVSRLLLYGLAAPEGNMDCIRSTAHYRPCPLQTHMHTRVHTHHLLHCPPHPQAANSDTLTGYLAKGRRKESDKSLFRKTRFLLI